MPESREVERFPYSKVGPEEGPRRLRPIVMVSLITSERRISFPGLIDSGADVNVLPYSLGLALGLSWPTSRVGPNLGGKFTNTETRLVVLAAQIGTFPPVEFVFCWMAQDSGPLILGQTNFFQEFNVCFLGSEGIVELQKRGS